MKVNRQEFLNSLELVSPGLSSREIVEQSSCFAFNEGVVTTYNDEIACQHKTPFTGVGAVQAAPLLAILRKLVEDEIDVAATDEGLLVVKGKRRKAGIRMESELRLPFEDVEKPKKWKPLAEDFAEALQVVEQCASKDESVFAMVCIHLHPEFMEACDNYHAARYMLETGVQKPCLVRRDSIKHIIDLGMTDFSETAEWLHFRNKQKLILSCRRDVSEYPDLSKLYKGKGVKTSLPKGLIEAVDKAEVFSAENTDANQVRIELQPGRVRLRGEGASGFYQEIKKLEYEGDPMDFFISPILLRELIQRHSSCQVCGQTLKVKGNKFVCVTSLKVMEDENDADESVSEDEDSDE